MTREERDALDVLERVAMSDGPGSDEAWESLCGFRSGRIGLTEALAATLDAVNTAVLHRRSFDRALDNARDELAEAEDAIGNARHELDKAVRDRRAA